jgi:hypothetical protein
MIARPIGALRPRSKPRISCSAAHARGGSCAFARMDASVRSFTREDVLRMLEALKLALSNTMRVVPSEIALSAPRTA